MSSGSNGASPRVPVADAGLPQAADPRRWIALSVVLTASFMVLMDISIVVVAIPSVQTNLSASYSQVQFVLAGYQLAYGAGLITGGRLGDIFGRKRMFITGVGGFVIASMLCGLAQTPEQLIAARVLQGAMGALMYPQVLSVIQVSFPPRERGAAFGALGGVIGLATISGPLIGGLLIQANLLGSGWRPIFLVNVPIGVAAILAAIRFLHESKSPKAPKLDLAGVVIATGGLVLLLFPIVEGRDAGWPAWTFVMLACSVVVLAAFAIHNGWRDRTQGSALVEPALFEDRAFDVGLITAIVFFAGIPAFFLVFSIFMQTGLGYTALQAGLTTAPFSLGSALASGLSIRLAPKIGKGILQIGAAIFSLGLLLSALIIHVAGQGLTGYELIPTLFVSGVGLGCMVAPFATIVLSGIHHGHAGSASGVLATSQQVGGALGVAVIGVIFFGQIGSHAPAVSSQHATVITARLEEQHVPQVVAEQISAQFARCFNDRSAERDPTVIPASCHGIPQSSSSTTNSPIGSVVQSQAQQALASNFSHAMIISVFSIVGLFVVVFLLVFALPNARLSHAPPSD